MVFVSYSRTGLSFGETYVLLVAHAYELSSFGSFICIDDGCLIGDDAYLETYVRSPRQFRVPLFRQ